METNNQGLTLEEKIIFTILGAILVIAMGVLIINYFSKHERKLEDNNTTPITENRDQENKVDDTKSNDSEGSLIEAVTKDNTGESSYSRTIVSQKTSKVTQTKATTTKQSAVSSSDNTSPSSNDNNEGTGSTSPETPIEETSVENPAEETPAEEPVNEDELDWEFNSSLITEAEDGDEVIVPSTVTLSNGTEKEAVITIRRREGNTLNIVEFTDNKLPVTTGEYVYSYTCNSRTKEIILTVKEKQIIESISLTSSENPTEEEQDLVSNSTLSKQENSYKLIVNRHTEYNNVLLRVKLKDNYTSVQSNASGVTATSLNNSELVLKLDLATVGTGSKEINLNVDGKDYVVVIDITINNLEPEKDKEEVEEEKEEQQEQQEEEKEADEEKPGPPTDDSEVEGGEPTAETTNTSSEDVTNDNVGNDTGPEPVSEISLET